MSDVIHLLPDHVANQIAAGEVVQRPASVVKELLENALDAGAGTIKLLIKNAGKTGVQVIDDGVGMSETDARLCFERHATSKIRKATDLFNLHTKGFRGEALASIAAIAHVELKTKQAGDELGTRIYIEGSKVLKQEPVAMPVGTSISVKNLFYNIPARRNFLKSDTVETRHIINEFQRVALAHPGVVFFMYHNDHEVYHLPSGNLKQRIVAIFGSKTNEKLAPIQEDTPIVKISGFVAKPEFAKKKRGEQFFFVNNRFIKTAYLNHAVKSAFEGLISESHHPTYFLFLEVPPETVDINIHPTKTEVKFENEKDIYAIIRATVKHSLGQYSIAPVLDFDRDPGLDTPYKYKDKIPKAEPPVKVDKNFNPFTEQKAASWESLYSGLENEDLSKHIRKEEEEQVEMFDTAAPISTSPKTQQLHQKYIVSPIKSGMVFIHQNRAHQRVLYEDFLSRMTQGDVVSQNLLFPLHFQFDKQDMRLFREIQDDLKSSGFVFEKIQDDGWVVSAIPASIKEDDLEALFNDILVAQKEDLPDNHFSRVDYLAKILAKRAAVKTGQVLSVQEQEDLLNKLFTCKEPNVSPFGKACFTTLTINEIDKRL